jgi:hypothetical protein
MEQDEVGRSGGKSSMLDRPREDNPSGGSRPSSSSASESRPPKQARSVIQDPSGDPGDIAEELKGAGGPHLDGLTADAMQLVRDKPLGAAITAFGVGLVLGLVLGILVGRD